MWTRVSSFFAILVFVSSVCLISSSGFLLCDCHSVGDPPDPFDPAITLPAPSAITLALAIIQFLTAFLLAIQNIRRGYWLWINLVILVSILVLGLVTWTQLKGSSGHPDPPRRLIAYWVTLAIDLVVLTASTIYFALFCPHHHWTSSEGQGTLETSDIEKAPLTTNLEDSQED